MTGQWQTLKRANIPCLLHPQSLQYTMTQPWRTAARTFETALVALDPHE